jgi:vacuolar-type H+-ATPase subunit B/Vma2
MTERKTSDVGYMNPPEHTRYKKGKSGNPRGRPRKREDLNTGLQRALNRKIRVKDNDQKLPIRDALIRKLRELALQGDKQALALQRRIIDEADIGPSAEEMLREKRDRILKAFERMGVEVKWPEGEK